mmetsp:Transcript_44439/g.105992  ORF Transcript_44439/g.105992 Transcript_44439/m.105992 type:complete len:223 (+) Transcript_44439:292-960(+)
MLASNPQQLDPALKLAVAHELRPVLDGVVARRAHLPLAQLLDPARPAAAVLLRAPAGRSGHHPGAQHAHCLQVLDLEQLWVDPVLRGGFIAFLGPFREGRLALLRDGAVPSPVRPSSHLLRILHPATILRIPAPPPLLQLPCLVRPPFAFCGHNFWGQYSRLALLRLKAPLRLLAPGGRHVEEKLTWTRFFVPLSVLSTTAAANSLELAAVGRGPAHTESGF